MFSLEELEQLVAFADYGTLTGAAEALHISQPTLTRTMQKLEEEFNARLFSRGKNRIELNETGMLAVNRARILLKEAGDAIRAVREFDRSLNTIRVESCAPAPLWTYLPHLSKKHPSKAISSELKDIPNIIQDVRNGNCEIGILPYSITEDDLTCTKLMTESLSVCLKPGHPLMQPGLQSLTLEELNGYNCLLRSEIGFWDKLCREKMPASRFLVQEDEYEFFELIRNSTLPYFITDLVDSSEYVEKETVVIPITNEEANVTYYLITYR